MRRQSGDRHGRERNGQGSIDEQSEAAARKRPNAGVNVLLGLTLLGLLPLMWVILSFATTTSGPRTI